MKRIKLNRLTILALLIVSLVLVACPKHQVILTPEQEAERVYWEQKDQWNEASKIFTDALTSYNIWCDKPEFAEACAKADTFWKKANVALDTWEKVIEAKGPSAVSQAKYQAELKALKTKMLMELPEFIW